jgi:Sugar (and other) transporter
LVGDDQGVCSIVLVMDQFLQQFPRVSEHASGAGFWMGLLTALIELGAFLGALNHGWIADKISRKSSIIVAVVIFIIGSVLQTAAVGYAMLTTARLIGGIGIGMPSMVAPLYISEISPPEVRHTSGSGRILHRQRNCRFLDHLWHLIHSKQPVMEVAFPAPDGTCFRSGRRDLFPALFAWLVDVERRI